MKEFRIKSAEVLRNAMLYNDYKTIRKTIMEQAKLGYHQALLQGNLAEVAISIQDYLREQGYKVLVNQEDKLVVINWWDE